MNDNYVLCVEHFQINASEPRSNYDSGDEYRAFLNKHRGLVEQGSYGKLEILLDEEGIAFSTRNLVDSLLQSLKSKIPKIPLYKQAAREYIETGTSIASVQEDLAKRMEVWFLIEDVTPTTSADSLFSSEDVLGVMDECDGLEGFIYAHVPFVAKLPRFTHEIIFIHNDKDACAQLRGLVSCNLDQATAQCIEKEDVHGE